MFHQVTPSLTECSGGSLTFRTKCFQNNSLSQLAFSSALSDAILVHIKGVFTLVVRTKTENKPFSSVCQLKARVRRAVTAGILNYGPKAKAYIFFMEDTN